MKGLGEELVSQLLIFQRKHELSHLMQMYLEKREQMLNQLRVLD